MTWGVHAINNLNLNNLENATHFLKKSYEKYIRLPFNVWCEYTSEEDCGAVNFITGAGGFLQVILQGYAGISLRHDHLFIKKTTALPNVSEFSVHGINYQGTKFSIYNSIYRNFLEFDSINSNIEIVVVMDDGIEIKACVGSQCKFIVLMF